jgi:hypothetical protein
VVRSPLHACLPVAVALLGNNTATAIETARASAVSDVAVTVYRAPDAQPNAFDLDVLGGFALVTETRTVAIPQGESRIRFEGVADGIESQSAIITGLPEGVLEKNQDAHVLSPAALVTATLGRQVWLVRTNRKTGNATQVAGTLVADNDGVLFKSTEGIEALRCSGLPETFRFESATDANATPTLSALVRSPAPTTAKVRLSYLAHGFDWRATYSATVSPDSKTMNLGAWVTLANGNGVSFNDAHTQVVAGRLNRTSAQVEPVVESPEIVASCWPSGTTSDIPLTEGPAALEEAITVTAMRKDAAPAPMMARASFELKAAGNAVQEEQLGDLKLYRVPERTSVTSRQIKQVRLLDRTSIPVELIYTADIAPNAYNLTQPLKKILRTRNDEAHHLGLPLPSGRVSTFYEQAGVALIVSDAPLRDIAVNEEVEFNAGESPDVRVTTVIERIQADPSPKELPLIPGVVNLHVSDLKDRDRVEITNARPVPVTVELPVHLPDGTNIVRADHIPQTRNGFPTFRLTVPAQGNATILFQAARSTFAPVRPR